MRYRNCLFVLAFCLALGMAPADVYSQIRQGTNHVDGTIRDPTNKPVYNAWVELYNDVGQMVDRQRSTTQGKFRFKGMGPGRYTVHIKPFGSNLREQVEEIEINNQTTGSDYVMLSVRLRADKRYNSNEISIVGTVYAQEVPANAKRLYSDGIGSLESDQKGAQAKLEEAIAIFPTYFDALAALGKSYVLTGEFEKGYPFLLRAIDVNQRCADCFYSMALAFYKLDQIPAGVKAIDAAAALSPQVAVVRLLQGMIYRMNNELPKAEKALLTAKSLSAEPNPEIHWQLSLVYNRMKRNEDAAKELEAYLNADPDLSRPEKQKIKDLIGKLRATK
ncbi:MAG: carboxypeptidase regulatory-like domain-containing protein [Pyrinomonadaceae bacterium]